LAARDVQEVAAAETGCGLHGRALQRLADRMKAILTYHSIDGSGSAISVGPAAFRRHAEWLAGSSVSVLSLADLVERPPSGPALALTFDDAFENFSTHAWPVLESLDLPATLCVPTAHVGARNAWEVGGSLPVLPLLGWDGLGKLAEAGVEIAAHSHTHADLRSVSRAELQTELDVPAQRIREELGIEVTTFAYPYGGVDQTVAEATGRTYRMAVTTQFDLLGGRDDRYRLPRLDAWYFRDGDLLEHFGTRSFSSFVTRRRRLRRVRSMWRRG
jgi:peptidoglycan/xylan/chitin deacetylase (PgdA/CDA1 family)